MADTTIPGFTADQSWALEQVLERAVSKGVSSGIEAYQKRHCVEHQDKTRALERSVFGAAEDGVVGLDERMNRLEAFEARVSRLTWLVIAQLIVLIGIAAAVGLRLG